MFVCQPQEHQKVHGHALNVKGIALIKSEASLWNIMMTYKKMECFPIFLYVSVVYLPQKNSKNVRSFNQPAQYFIMTMTIICAM